MKNPIIYKFWYMVSKDVRRALDDFDCIELNVTYTSIIVVLY